MSLSKQNQSAIIIADMVNVFGVQFTSNREQYKVPL